MTGLRPAAEQHFAATGESTGRRFYEAVVGTDSPLEGATLKTVGFRGRYGAAVFAVHRAGERVSGKLGDVRLRTGDVLLLVAERGFDRRWRDGNDFLVVSPLDGAVPAAAREGPNRGTRHAGAGRGRRPRACST